MTEILASATPEMHQQIISALDASLITAECTIYISAKPKPRKTRKKEGKRLITLETEEIPETGTCPGGTYHYVTDRERLLKLLHHWINQEAWVAIDLETGVAWREKADLETDDVIRYYVEIIDPHTCPIYLVSMSVEPGVAIVFDMRLFQNDEEFLSVWKLFLVTCKFIAHNSMFEQCFLCAHFGVLCNIVYDTMLVHQLMTAGQEISSRLGDMLDRYCGVHLDKEWQKMFLSIDYRSPLPAEAIAYSAGDVTQLLILAQKLEEELQQSGLHDVWTRYEQPFMRWLALAKVEGIAIDKPFFEQMNQELGEEITGIYEKFVKLCPNVLISSPLQLKKWFTKQGIELRSTDVEALKKLADLPAVGEVAQTILAHRKLAKMKGTYVEPMLSKFPSPVTGKVHPNWGQLFTATGRMNCNDPAIQTIPSRDEWVKLRKGFVAKPGHRLAYCVTPHTRILTCDLTWKPAWEVAVGEKLIGFDEDLSLKSSHCMRESVITNTSRLIRPCYRITTDKGIVTCSSDHMWVIRKQGKKNRIWERTEDIRTGDTISFFAKPWLVDDSWESGYLSSFFDGEGYCSEGVVGFGQNPGPTLDQVISILREKGFDVTFCEKPGNATECWLKTQPGDKSSLRFLGSIRPKRLMRDLSKTWENRRSWGHSSEPARVMSVEFIGQREVIALETSTHTFIAEGFFSHNCDYSQFEVRAMADMSGEDRMISVFEEAEAVGQQLHEYCAQNNLPVDLRDKAKKDPEAASLLQQHPKIVELENKLANCDFHRITASLLFGTPVEEIDKEKRAKAKAVTFGKPYGAGPKTIARSAGISIEEARVLFQDYDVKFPKLAAFFERCREQAKRGYTESPGGRRRFYQQPDIAQIFARVKAIYKAGGDEWEELTETWGSSDPHEITNKLHFAKIGAIEREGMNHPIQASNADATKLATIIAAPRLQALHPECIIIAWVHDEIILTAPEQLVEQAAGILRASMIESAQTLLTRTPVDVSCTISASWGK